MIETPPTLMALASRSHARALAVHRDKGRPRSTVPRLDSVLEVPRYLAAVREAYAAGGEDAAISALRGLAWSHARGRPRNRAEFVAVRRWLLEVVDRDTATVRDAVDLGWLRRDEEAVAAERAERARRDALELAERHHRLDEADARERFDGTA